MRQILNFRTQNPRRNLPAELGKKRGEANFAGAFERVYLEHHSRSGVGGRYFAMSGFGIADFVWISWRSSSNPEEATALSLETIKKRLNRQHLTAFEIKLASWRKAVSQAYRYGYFADRAVVVLPPEAAKVAKAHLCLFRKLRVGLWSFDSNTGKIRKFFTPRPQPRNPYAKEKAIELLARRLNFRELFKKGHPLKQGK